MLIIFDILSSGLFHGVVGIISFFLWSQTIIFHPEDALIKCGENTSLIFAHVSLMNLIIAIFRINKFSEEDSKIILNLALILSGITLYMGYNLCGTEGYDNCWANPFW